ncbi:MAG: helix-turn-helix transcriptional regulator [Aphanocapsa sp. GSE-SYN-MK-11-07L]|jgi:AraC-like DNA-binding protein|nr:helix-turn-helix transcriptional regulator [Aphanocapsa sp. GSE-SYN-MK-11-07L]
MTITLTEQEESALWEEAEQVIPPRSDPDCGSWLQGIPKQFGNGYNLDIALHPDCWLTICHHSLRDHLCIRYPESAHPVQFAVMLSGSILDSQGGMLDSEHVMISGSGVQAEIAGLSLSDQPHLLINLELSPDRLMALFPNAQGELPAELKFLVQENDWQTLIYPKTNPAIQRVAYEMLQCPYQGAAKRLYLQGKSQELMMLILAPIVAEQGNPKPPPRMKPMTITQLYAARDLLKLRFEQPPSLSELANQVWVSERTLQRGFQELFGTTVMGYVAEQRLRQAERLLQQRTLSVTEVAHRVGYSHLGHFATAFKRQFGITPSECLGGKTRDLSSL